MRSDESSREVFSAAQVRLQLTGFPLLPALECLSSSDLPLDRLNLSGSASGNVEVLWVGTIRDAETRLNLNIEPALKQTPEEIPVRGQIDGLYRRSRDELEVSQLHLTTSGSEITATGNLLGNLIAPVLVHQPQPEGVDAACSKRPSIVDMIGQWLVDNMRNLPFTVHGWATLAGYVSGGLSALSVNGNLEVYDFDTILPATNRVSSRVVHWDALSTAVQFSSDHFAAHNGSVIHGHTTAHFDASTALTAWALPEDAPFTLHLDLRNADVAEIAHIAGLAQPFAGTLDMSANRFRHARQSPRRWTSRTAQRHGLRSGCSFAEERSSLRWWRASVQQHRSRSLRCCAFRERRGQHGEFRVVEKRVPPESFRT